MKASPGRGKWRLKGRGRRLSCARPDGFVRWDHGVKHVCIWCGQSMFTIFKDYNLDEILHGVSRDISEYATPIIEGEIGVIEKVRFI